jgi:TPR repeat protein
VNVREGIRRLAVVILLTLSASLTECTKQTPAPAKLYQLASEGDTGALKQLTALADSGNSRAQERLGRLYAVGEGVPKDASRATVWWRKAAEGGNADAQYSVGLMYEDGTGVSKDSAQALMWFRKSAEQGDPFRQVMLGNRYYDGDTVTKDVEQAVVWYRKAAEQDDPVGQYKLGLSYATGEGVPKDAVLAYMWLNLASAHKLGLGASDRDTLAEGMNPAQVSEAQQMSREWKPKK